MPGGRPNLLFLFPDQWRWDWLGCHDGSGTIYGDAPVRTPTIDALAARGTRYTRCRTNSPLCAPARACLAQGVRYGRCGVIGNGQPTPTDTPNVFRLLRDAGYHTMTCGKSDLFKPDPADNPTGYVPVMEALGFADGIDHRGKGDAVNRARRGVVEPYTKMLAERGLLDAHLADHPEKALQRPARPSALPADAHTDTFAADNALRLLDRAPGDRPWLLWVNFPGPHDPYDPPAEALAGYSMEDFAPPVNYKAGAVAFRDWPADRLHYAASCSWIDRQIARLLERVAERGEMDDTLVVFASDHGEMLGDHGRWTKAVALEGSVRVPLIVAGPGVGAGEVRDDLVELIDVGASLLTAGGVAVSGEMDARPLSVHGGLPREVQHSALGDWEMVCDGRFKYARHVGRDSPGSLWDLDADPAETTNRRDDFPDDLARLRACLAAEAARLAV
ncbi:MAG: sulfatase-like hydrolase/transferase [Planctomycetota bacterium]